MRVSYGMTFSLNREKLREVGRKDKESQPHHHVGLKLGREKERDMPNNMKPYYCFINKYE